jgi:hypothetical protein
MLASLYFVSQQDLDNMRALTFMVFFTFYTASENLYRKTKWILSFYLCILIYYNYYNSLLLVIKPFNKLSEYEKYKLKWYNLIVQKDCEESNKWNKDTSIYFRHTPDQQNLAVLFILSLLGVINNIFLDQKLANDISNQSSRLLHLAYPKQMLYLEYVKNFLASQSGLSPTDFIVVCIVIFYIS